MAGERRGMRVGRNEKDSGVALQRKTRNVWCQQPRDPASAQCLHFTSWRPDTSPPLFSLRSAAPNEPGRLSNSLLFSRNIPHSALFGCVCTAWFCRRRGALKIYWSSKYGSGSARVLVPESKRRYLIDLIDNLFLLTCLFRTIGLDFGWLAGR
jgi:hypothetical protein